MYKEVMLFYMTGTGNSYKIAEWSAAIAEEFDAVSQLHQVKAGNSSVLFNTSDLLVFSFPTHGFTAPWLIIRFVLGLRKGNKTHAVILPSRAGIRVKGVFLPGLEGTAGYLIALLLYLTSHDARATQTHTWKYSISVLRALIYIEATHILLLNFRLNYSQLRRLSYCNNK